MRKSNQLAAKYLTRALSLEPENQRWQAALKRAQEEPVIARVPEPTPGVKRITVGGPVQMAKLKSQVQPVYPELAKQARIQGIVRFTAVLGTDGTVKNLTLLGGHPLFVQAATEAVKQWVYQPTLLNGEPVEVVSNIDVNFTLDESPQAEEPAQQDAYRIGGGVSAPVPIFKVEPEFPKGLPGDPAGGAVMLSIVVGSDGGVTVVQPLRGDPAFYENAIEAVKKWKFRPAMKEGQPVSVKANVEVNFRKM